MINLAIGLMIVDNESLKENVTRPITNHVNDQLMNVH